MTQPSLFHVSPVPRPLSTPYQRTSETSRDAAHRAERFVGRQGAKVLAYIASRGEQGATQKEADAALEIGRPSVAARFNGLEHSRLILKTAAKRGGCFVYTAEMAL